MALAIAVSCLFLLCLEPVVIEKGAHAQVVINPLPFTPGQRRFGMRMHPIQRVMKMHYGVDYPIPIGTNVPYQGNFQGCTPNNGAAGNMVTIGNACGVRQIFMHLDRCQGQSIISGNSGGSTGPHLHYEIHIGSTKIDPMAAFGQDLCQESVRTQLIEDARRKGSTGGSASDGAGSNEPAPPAQPGNINTENVPTGGVNPITGLINLGPPLVIIRLADGRVYTELAYTDFWGGFSVLPPTTEDVVPRGAQTADPVSGCATDTWTAMVNKAVLETRRENVVNQRYILKPDSVFAYSCFETQVRHVGETVGPIFSETQRWVNAQVDIIGATATINRELGENSLDGSLHNAPIVMARSFTATAFRHGILGGTQEPPVDLGFEDEEDGTGSGQSMLPCGTMAEVWQLAKCSNMMDANLFQRFEDMIGNDIRVFPRNMACSDTGITQNMINISRNMSVQRLNVQGYFEMLAPEGNCYAPISTGVTVYRRSGAGIISDLIDYRDALCISPGCSYQNDGEGAGECTYDAPDEQEGEEGAPGE